MPFLKIALRSQIKERHSVPLCAAFTSSLGVYRLLIYLLFVVVVILNTDCQNISRIISIIIIIICIEYTFWSSVNKNVISPSSLQFKFRPVSQEASN